MKIKIDLFKNIVIGLCCQNVCRVYSTIIYCYRMIDGEMYYSLSKNNRRIRRYKHPIKKYDENLMKICHFNHPSNVWVRETKGNYIWLYTLLDYSLQEYTERYNKIHGVQWRMDQHFLLDHLRK